MKRRHFLKTTSLAATVPVFVNGMAVNAIANSSIFSAINGDSDRVLVLIQLNGGNDGLSTILPLDQYDNLANLRGNILIPENSALNLEDNVGLHPNLGGIKDIYDDGKMTIVNSVGYPTQNRSHFRSTDIWMSGSAADEIKTTGWLGGYFDSQYENFPTDYPNADCPDPFAITIGSQVSATCQGMNGNFSMAINDPFNLNPLATGGSDDVPNTPYGEELTFLRLAIEQSNAYADVITDAADLGTNMVDYPADNALAQKLKNVALMIAGGLRTKVYIVSLGGFDTHANQTTEDSPVAGEHAVLMSTLSSAIAAFQADIQALGLGERVLGMTFSEFGRRIRSNASFGTDHGDAAPLILFGNCVNPGIVGENPTIGTPDQVDTLQGIEMQYNFRNIYGSVLMDWFEATEDDVKNLLFADFEYMPVLNPCELIDSTDDTQIPSIVKVKAAPNPFSKETILSFESGHEHVDLRIMNSIGQEVAVLVNKTLPAGPHSVTFNGANLSAGTYYYQLKLESGAHKSGLLTRLK